MNKKDTDRKAFKLSSYVTEHKAKSRKKLILLILLLSIIIAFLLIINEDSLSFLNRFRTPDFSQS